VGKAGGHIELALVVRGQHDRNGLAKGRRAAPDVDGDIEDFALQDIDQLALGVGILEMQTAQDAAPGVGEIVLDEARGQAGLDIARLVPGFHEKAAGVAEDARFENDDTGDGSFYALHGGLAIMALNRFKNKLVRIIHFPGYELNQCCRITIINQAHIPMTALDILREVFGYPAFRGPQADIVDHVSGGGDALVLMPTGGGKSLCYQIPSLLRPGVGVVVSPLIALMHDQVAALDELGVRSAYLNSSLDAGAAQAIERGLLAGDYDLIYVAPERLMLARFQALLDQLASGPGLALFAIDEAHCVSQWGHDFRPEYIQLSILAERFPAVPRIALTATADPETRAEIVEKLHLQGARQFVSSFDRPNIRYRIVDKANARNQLLAFIRDGHQGDAGIVYCLSRRKVEETAEWLVQHGIQALPYHAGMDAALRRRNQDRFLREDGIVMTATIAFGMGIDKPDVRFVAHLDLPKSIEGYYQETGRAGRDGAPAEAWMAYGLADAVQQRRMIEEGDADPAFKRLAHARLDELLALCESATCRRQRLLAHFAEDSPPCGNCDVCLEPPETWDGTQVAQQALSCVYRTGQRFGAGHVIDVLLGHDTERIRQWGHNTLSTYGIGKALNDKEWRAVIRQLVALGLLDVDHAGYGGLRLTTAARPILKGEQTLMLRRQVARKRVKEVRRSSLTQELDAVGEVLFQLLREWRAETAKVHGVPAYVIFHDATLAAIAGAQPQTLEDLHGISGIGSSKLARYGDEIIALCRGAE
jgi:ATP-dependent DNA helicase RecQ